MNALRRLALIVAVAVLCGGAISVANPGKAAASYGTWKQSCQSATAEYSYVTETDWGLTYFVMKIRLSATGCWNKTSAWTTSFSQSVTYFMAKNTRYTGDGYYQLLSTHWVQGTRVDWYAVYNVHTSRRQCPGILCQPELTTWEIDPDLYLAASSNYAAGTWSATSAVRLITPGSISGTPSHAVPSISKGAVQITCVISCDLP